ncbi:MULTISPECIES: hypothetical protein [unclassified Mesorhizobium]|uniref:hypothetical protein n=1 Tax=unclassified Mesorhizobium TaxID=325217 RepID=UPI000BAF6F9E|nr:MULTISPECIES: hypothetical protein [unclassified Mesorhizobium]TGT56838.1 hypothetical protein EN813_041185 [Mesorhizobium sp. M00.F.Ca.ET.170.01.1.1]AZO08604.1 hypothetical protein EJ074_05285 [Mesorhizobium sp. M3A.F.Ca.ET.080.04.2.1]PBB85485.1 hypothetical protein CK216_17670 [Mesorhizobium sp. WSM3876]RWB71721.1 MAG: hypothetical protein EOQ49_14495 [Mesorhizobium sp.]RWB85027.1 MAG: hypothetical protein EOQ52_22415 [Mesorhizobium sp.]
MTPISIRREAESGPANDNHPSDNPSILDLIPADDDAAADIARRTERLGIAVVIAIALCLLIAPAIYVTLTYATSLLS